MPDLLTVGEAAKKLRLSTYFIYRAAERGEFPVLRFGRAIRVDMDRVREWAENRPVVKA